MTKIKLLAAGALLFSFGVATSAVATSAWYSLLDSTVVGDLNVQINLRQDDWLELHLLNHGMDISYEDGRGFSKEELGIEGKTLGEVSGMFESDWLNEDTDLSEAVPKFHSRYKPGLSKTNSGYSSQDDAGGFYVQNEFYFEAGTAMELYLDQSSCIEPNAEMNRQVAEEKGFSDDIDRVKALDDVVHAVRISILTDEGYMIIKRGETGDTYYGGILDLDKDGYYDYNPDNNKEYLYGEYSGDVNYLPGETNETSDEKKDNRNTFVANHKQGVEKVDIDNSNLNIKKERAYKLSDVSFDENDPLRKTPICHVKKNERKRMILSIYVEGWDQKMTNDIASASFDITIAFTALIKN